MKMPESLHWSMMSQPLREAVSWNGIEIPEDKQADVSLFVRLWVEIFHFSQNPRKVARQPLREAVSWNVAIKVILRCRNRQPLREAVSWNATSWEWDVKHQVSLFVRLWVEMSTAAGVEIICEDSQPLREAVSWNVIWHARWLTSLSQPLREAVSWNIFRERKSWKT